MAPAAVERCAAKLNLFLDVVGRRADGYHELVTVFHEIDLADRLSGVVTGDGDVTLEVHGGGAAVPMDANNLAARAARLLLRDAGAARGIALRLEKTLPVGAGLGGGSADAAAALRLVDRLLDLRTPSERLHALAAELGSDVPFLLRGGTCLARGRGERLERVPVGPPPRFLVLLPGFGISTAAVYAALPRELPPPVDPAPLLRALASGDVRALAASTHNALLPAALAVEPRLAQVLDAVRDQLGPGVQLTGSGSALFLPFRGDPPDVGDLPHGTTARVV